MFQEGKRGQVTIFIIIALVIVGVVLVLFLYPQVSLIGGAEFSPNSYLKSCLEPKIKASTELLSQQGGYANPEGFIVYQDQKVKYLCYTSKYYEKCVVQQPMIVANFEKELKSLINDESKTCISNLKSEYEKRGYSVSTSSVDTFVSFVPKQIKVTLTAPITITKEESQTFRTFDLGFDSQMYDLLTIATSIVDFESTYGDAETTTYTQYYPDLKVEKTLIEDGSKIYKISNVVSKESFLFASRSVAWPAGYTGG